MLFDTAKIYCEIRDKYFAVFELMNVIRILFLALCSLRFIYFIAFWLIRSHYSMQSAALSTEVVDAISVSLPIPVSFEEPKRGRKMLIHRLRRRTTKCLPRKCTWKGLNALPSYRLPCPSLPTLWRSSVFIALFPFPP